MDVTEIKIDRFASSENASVFDWLDLLDNLLNPQFTISDINIAHRTILHWEKEELINKQDSGGWRRYSFCDYIWLRMLREMRNFGVPINTLKTVKKELFSFDKEIPTGEITDETFIKAKGLISELPEEEIKNTLQHFTKDDLINQLNQNTLFSRLNSIILEAIYTRVPFYLLLNPDGTFKISVLYEEGFAQHVDQLLNTFEKQSTLLINITKIIADFYSSEKFSGKTYFNLTPVSRQEKEIIDIIRSGGVNKIDITLKGGEHFFVEIQRRHPAQNFLDQVQRIIAKNNYSRITFDSENGRVTYINEVEKKIIK
ncbi:MAG: MerR family transcriptional regulator [Flavitalea sp.]